jgi:hypothetical protein
VSSSCFGTQGLTLARQELYHLSHSTNPSIHLLKNNYMSLLLLFFLTVSQETAKKELSGLATTTASPLVFPEPHQ